MKKRIFHAWMILVLTLLFPASLALFAFALPAQYTETFLGGYADKLAILHAAGGKRIILAGGSGTAFAVRSDLLASALPDYAVVNLGMYAGLGSTVPLDAVLPGLQEGDVVVFLPEQSRQTLSLYFGSEAMWQAADGHWQLLRTVSDDHWRAMLGQLPYFAAQKARFFLQGTPPAGDGIYTRSAFNAWGDIGSPLRDTNTMPGGYDANTPITFEQDLPEQRFIDYVNRYAQQCAQRGASFYFGFCPMNRDAVDATGLDAYMLRLSGSLRCPLLGSASESIMESGWFFDSNFHLNSAGAIVYTAQLARQLGQALALPLQGSIALPEMPGAVRGETLQGDDGDAACFTYTREDAGWLITGLSEAGLERTRLTVPTRYQGSPIVGFAASTFAGNTDLASLTLQANIRFLPDGAFNGCTGLRTLRLLDMAPSDCTPGTELLRGTEALVYVDREQLPAYQTNYFWAVYALRLRAAEASSDAVPSAPAHTDAPAAGERCLLYAGNGGYLPGEPDTDTLSVPIPTAHLRVNTLQGGDAFVRPGYALLAWNTAADGSGVTVGLGSRFDATGCTTLYAQWIRESDPQDLSWRIEQEEVLITGYRGTGETCVIPSTLEGFPVRVLCSGAFRNASLTTLVLPPTLRTIEPEAFSGCTLRTLYLSDTLQTISDACFSGCDGLTTLHISAATPPVYSISYYASFADKYDWLLSLSGQRKLVLFSGSSTRYGYDSAMLHRHYPSFQVANMGVYAYTNALPQLELIRQCMEKGDVLLHAPEFDCLNFQFCEHNRLDFHFWAMMEANYDCVSMLDLHRYSQVFDSLQQYLTIRQELPARAYADSPNGYDDDGNNMHTPTYNQYGDFIMPRANNKDDVMLKFVRAEYTTAPFTSQRLASLNEQYQAFLRSGIQVLFTYTPRNRSSLSEDSTPENRRALDLLLREQLCVPVISRMEDSLMSGIYFFVIDSHLSNEGARLHTLQIIQDLAPWLSEE